jgi:hypothetical protein
MPDSTTTPLVYTASELRELIQLAKASHSDLAVVYFQALLRALERNTDG